MFQFVIRLPLRQHLLEGTEPPSLASVRAQAELIHEALPDLPEHIVRERAVASFDLVLLQVAERARIIDDEDGRGLLAEDEWMANLVDMATGLLTAPRRSARLPAIARASRRCLADRPARLVGLRREQRDAEAVEQLGELRAVGAPTSPPARPRSR